MNIGLCEGRHPMPVESYIFPQVVESPLDFAANFNHATSVITDYDGDHITLYVSGLTPVLTATILAITTLGRHTLTLMHYNRDSGDFVAQPFIEEVSA